MMYSLLIVFSNSPSFRLELVRTSIFAIKVIVRFCSNRTLSKECKPGTIFIQKANLANTAHIRKRCRSNNNHTCSSTYFSSYGSKWDVRTPQQDQKRRSKTPAQSQYWSIAKVHHYSEVAQAKDLMQVGEQARPWYGPRTSEGEVGV